jgi:hypothetical protein
MKIAGIRSVIRKKRYHGMPNGTRGKVFKNLLKRNFKANKPNQK